MNMITATRLPESLAAVVLYSLRGITSLGVCSRVAGPSLLQAGGCVGNHKQAVQLAWVWFTLASYLFSLVAVEAVLAFSIFWISSLGEFRSLMMGPAIVKGKTC